MSRLPEPGGDDNQWGNILNSFLLVSHNSDASLRGVAVQQALPIGSDGQVLTYDQSTHTWRPKAAAVSSIDESDLVHLDGTETITGAKNFTGGLTTYGIGLVQTDDVRLINERPPIDGSITDAKIADDAAIAQSKIAGLTTTLAGKIDTSEMGIAGGVATLDASGHLVGTQLEPQPEATATKLGVIQLDGDFGGTAQAPTLSKIQGYNVATGNTPVEGQAFTYVSGAWQAKDITPAGYVRGDGIAKITVGSTAPTNPAVGDIWVDTPATP